MTFKQNLITIISSLILSFIFFFIIFLVHNLAFKTYTYKAQYSYICSTLCKYNNMKDLYKDLQEQFVEELDEYETLVNKLSYYDITSEEIESSVKIKRVGNTIVFTVKNKDSQKGFLIYFVMQKLFIDFELEEFNLTFSKTPVFLNYLKYSLFTGAVLGLLFIASDIKLIKIVKKEEVIIDELSEENDEN